MVFFSCDGCAEMLKKNQVDAHARKCRSCDSVSCVDCSVSFWGDDYRSHTSCISEAERYEKTIYKGPKKNDLSNRKLTPQETWMSIINESLKSCPSNLTSYIETIASFENVPRKEKAFRNFASNSLKLYGRDGEATITNLWRHFSAMRQKQMETKTIEAKGLNSVIDESNKYEDSIDDNVETCSDKKDSKEEETIPVGKMVPDKKSISKVIKKALKAAPKQELKFKKLRKIVKANSQFKPNTMGKGEWTKVIKETILRKKSFKLEGKTVTLIYQS